MDGCADKTRHNVYERIFKKSTQAHIHSNLLYGSSNLSFQQNELDITLVLQQ